MTDQTGIGWPTCDEDGCVGVRLATTSKCLAHARDEQRHPTLKQFGETGEIDARGVPITQTLLEQVLAAAPHDSDNHPTFKAARFDRATFQHDAWFDGATFQGDAVFDEATFQRTASFQRAVFMIAAEFRGATFQGGAWFRGATFQDYAVFLRTTFQGTAGFPEATFQREAAFDEVTFQGVAGFDGATFQEYAVFGGATFRDVAVFHRTTFHDVAGFGGVDFRRDAEFRDARFEQALQLGPLLVYGVLRLDAASFVQLIHIEASARGLSCQRTHFAVGVQFRLRGAQIVLDDADLSGPCILMGIAALSDARLARREQRLVQAVRRLAP
jgi:uncharacterized protein YjbI with pentapeptide repeats